MFDLLKDIWYRIRRPTFAFFDCRGCMAHDFRLEYTGWIVGYTDGYYEILVNEDGPPCPFFKILVNEYKVHKNTEEVKQRTRSDVEAEYIGYV